MVSPREAAIGSDGLGATAGTVPIVGLGASAGGIAALSQFFEAMPADSGFAFVVVLHLDPHQQSFLAQVLGNRSKIPVVEVADGMVVRPDRIHVIVPSYDVTVSGDTLRLTPSPASARHRHPVDVLFRSLAEQRGHRAIVVVLSGIGSNGTQGVREVRGSGGTVLIQKPLTAQFPGMPTSALETDLADYVLPPAEMPALLLRHRQHDALRPTDDAGSIGEPPIAFTQLLDHLNREMGSDFRAYRPPLLLRRINRRMVLRDVDSLERYGDLVRSDQAEAHALVRDLLINVTSFFRDPPAWEALDRLVVRPMLEEQAAGGALRIWIAACATGEEAYSLAMLFVERLEEIDKRLDLKIFASDVLEDNLVIARAGIYPAAAVETMPAARIRRFFEKIEPHYQVRRDLRDMVTFARQDLLRDPPFARVDLVSCRNMLIYIEPETQTQALGVFHFALKPGGILFLGTSESAARTADLYEAVTERWKIYRRVGPTRYNLTQLHNDGGGIAEAQGAPKPTLPPPTPRITDALRRALLDRFVPAAAVVNSRGRVVYLHGEVDDFLRQPPGEPTQDLFAMARGGLLSKLRTGLNTVRTEGGNVSLQVRVRHGGTVRSVGIGMAPLPVRPGMHDLFVVTFRTIPGPDPEPAVTVPPGELPPEIEAELHLTRAELQETIGELEYANEELSRANNDAVAMNEELQSANEELETSKEELQSFNEELHSVNSQLQHKIAEVEEVSNDLFNLLSGTEIAILFLDSDLGVKWASPAVTQLLDLVPGDVGRPLAHFARKFADEQLLTDAQRVLRTLMPAEQEVRSDEGAWFLRRIVPYRTRDHRIAGLVVSFFDVTARRLSASADTLRDLNEELERRVSERTEALEHANRELVRQRLEQSRVKEEMNFLAHHDRLTGLPNRRRFGNLLPPLLEQAERAGTGVAVLCLDLDGFKMVNDTLGHHAGDRLLMLVGQRLSALMRPVDVVARFGGDEFVAMRADVADVEEAVELAHRMVKSLGEPLVIDGQTVRIGASVGVTVAPRDGTEAERLLRNADIALYQAKADGGRRWRMFSSEMFLERSRRQGVEGDLREAIANNQFELHYQPMVSLVERRITAIEALLRWNHPVHGILAPGAFMRIAEETGVIVPIGRWVLQRACREAMSWPEGVAVAVNLSAAQLRDPTVLSTVIDVLTDTGLPASRLEIEVTETVMLDHGAETQRTLEQLRDLGMLIAMDDFGTGYSSLSQLRAFPYGKLKLDRSFISKLGQDADALVVVQTILALGEGLRMVVTAEGVETQQQLEILTRFGCPQVQGFLFGQPLDAEGIQAQLQVGLSID